jgi:Endoplasmic reticulum vesicle transporter
LTAAGLIGDFSDCQFYQRFLVFSLFRCRYDFSPIMVRLVETRQSFLYFLTSVCAILGGVFALSGIVDTVFHRAAEAAKNK